MSTVANTALPKSLYNYAQLMQEVVERQAIAREKHDFREYNLISANLLNFMPELPAEEHYPFYLDLLCYKKLAVYHSETEDAALNLEAEGNLEFKNHWKQKGYLFANYHLGSYRSLLGYFIKNGISFAVMVDDTVYEKQREIFLENIYKTRDYFKVDIDIDIISVGHPAAMIKLAEKLRQGISLIAYIDGNSGTGGVANTNKSLYLDIEFMGVPINSRKGIALLSYATKTPIIPVYNYFPHIETFSRLRFSDPITPLREPLPGKDEYIEGTTKRLYQVISDAMTHYARQWESWLYVQKFINLPELARRYQKKPEEIIDPESLQDGDKLKFNHRHFGLFKFDNCNYLFNKKDYSHFGVSNETFELLDFLSTLPEIEVGEAGISRGSAKTLFAKEVLIKITQ